MDKSTVVLWGFGAIGLALVYVFTIRPVLVHAPVLSAAFKEEAAFWDQLRAKVAGWKTKIASRLVVISGFMVASYDYVLPYATQQDWTPVTKRLPDWALPVFLCFIGWLFSYLRHVTENPPQVITQKTDDGKVQIVAMKPPGA